MQILYTKLQNTFRDDGGKCITVCQHTLSNHFYHLQNSIFFTLKIYSDVFNNKKLRKKSVTNCGQEMTETR